MEVLPVVIVVLFWLVAFVFAWWFTARALRAPIEYEEAHVGQGHDANSHAHTETGH